jgi:death-on-curing protein
MNEPIWVLDRIVESVHSKLLSEHGGPEGVRDGGLLSSALARPKQKFAYDSNASIFSLAAAYSFGLANNHPFVDGNKRTAFATGVVFLELNGYIFNANEVEAAITFEKIATGEIDEDELTSWFDKHCAEV